MRVIIHDFIVNFMVNLLRIYDEFKREIIMNIISKIIIKIIIEIIAIIMRGINWKMWCVCEMKKVLMCICWNLMNAEVIDKFFFAIVNSCQEGSKVSICQLFRIPYTECME